MKSERLELSTSATEVTNISKHGFWILLEERELFVPFSDFPWFRKAAVEAILNVEQPHSGHLYWPDLDVDLAVESIEHPERYPLVSRSQRSPEGARHLSPGQRPGSGQRSRTYKP